MKYNKLVRDRIPDIIRENGETPIVEKLSVAAFKKELKKKLVEEAGELEGAQGKDEILEELADIQEVLSAIYSSEKIAAAELGKIRSAKNKKRGGFSKRIFLKGVQ